MFYDRFYELCQRKGVTPTKVARDLGLRQSTVSMWKKQGTTPKYDTLKKLADYFEVTTDDLYDIKPLPEKKIELNLGYDKKTVAASSGALELSAFNAFLKELGFFIGIDTSLPINGDPKEAKVWIIADKREKKIYLAKSADIDMLRERILSFTKFEVYELLHRLTEDPRCQAPQSALNSAEGKAPTPPPEGSEGPPEGK